MKLYVWLQSRVASLRNQDGATAAEYGLLVALIAVVIIAGAQALGLNILAKLQNVATTIGGAGGS